MYEINKDTTKGRSAKTFKLDKNNPNNGLSKAILKEVISDTTLIAEDSKLESFQGKERPRLTFVFEQIMNDAAEEPGIYYFSYNAIEHTNEFRDDLIKTMFEYIYDFIKVYKGEINITPADYGKLKLTLDGDKSYKADEVLAAYKAFFDNVASVFNGYGENPVCIYKDADGKSYPMWLKLLISYSKGHVNNGKPGLNKFVGDGSIEKIVKDKLPTIKVNVAQGESVVDAPAPSKTPLGAGLPPAPDYMNKTQMPEDAPY